MKAIHEINRICQSTMLDDSVKILQIKDVIAKKYLDDLENR